jgi:peptide/nickel transport system substrate-binding protein
VRPTLSVAPPSGPILRLTQLISSSRPLIRAGLVSILLIAISSCRSSNDSNGIVVVLEKRIPSLDPRVSADSAAERFRQLVFNSLTRKNDRFEAVPDLAENFTVSDDRRVHTFKLRPGVKFHDGHLLSSKDVKYTFDSMLEPSFQSQKKVELARILKSVETPDDSTVVFTCVTACPGLPNIIIPIGIIPKDSATQQASSPIGTGPFRFDYYRDDQDLALHGFNEYFEGAPKTEHLNIRISPDSTTRESELRKGSVDLAINADLDPVSNQALKDDPHLKVEIKDGTNITHLGVNLNDKLLKDRRVRQAIAYALDRESIIRDVYYGQARIALSALPPAQWAYEPGVRRYDHNLEAAAKLLDEAGYKAGSGGMRLKITLKTSTLSIARRTGEIMQEQLRRAGIDLDLQPLERQKLTQDMIDGNFQLYLNQLVGGNQSTDVFGFLYSSKSIPPNGQNRSRYSNPVVDGLIEESAMASPDRQRQIFSEIQKTLAEDLPQIYLWYPSSIVIRRDNVADLDLDPSGDWRALRLVRRQ